MVDTVSDVRDYAAELGISHDEWSEFSPDARGRLAHAVARTDLRARLDNGFGQLDDRFKAYLELCADGRTRYRKADEYYCGDEIPTLKQLQKYLGRDRSSIGDMRYAIRYDRITHSTILCLAAIYPAVDAGQSPSEARRYRLAVADAWLSDPDGISLLDWLHMVILAPGDFNIRVVSG